MIFFRYGFDKENASLRNEIIKTIELYLRHLSISEILIKTVLKKQYQQ